MFSPRQMDTSQPTKNWEKTICPSPSKNRSGAQEKSKNTYKATKGQHYKNTAH